MIRWKLPIVVRSRRVGVNQSQCSIPDLLVGWFLLLLLSWTIKFLMIISNEEINGTGKNFFVLVVSFLWYYKSNHTPPYQAELSGHWRVSWSCHYQGDHRVPLACALPARCTTVPRVAQCLLLVLQCLVQPLCEFPLQSVGPWTATEPTHPGL